MDWKINYCNIIIKCIIIELSNFKIEVGIVFVEFFFEIEVLCKRIFWLGISFGDIDI